MTQHSHSVEPEHTELLSGTPSGELAAGSVVALQPGQRAEKPPPAPPDAVHQHRISEVQASVYRFLRYAASRSDIELGKALVDSLIPVLRRKPDMLTPEDEAVLWDGYNRVSKLVAPATDESLSITDQIRQARASPRSEAAKSWPVVNCIRIELRKTVYLLMFMLSVFVITQAYVILLTDALQDHADLREEYQAVTAHIGDLWDANPDIKEHVSPLKPLVDRQADLERKMEVTSRAEARLMEIWWWIYPDPAEAVSNDHEEYLKAALAIEGYSRSLLSILSQYVLPLILGLLGAIAYLVRRSLFSLRTTAMRRASGDSLSCACAWAGSLGSSAASCSLSMRRSSKPTVSRPSSSPFSWGIAWSSPSRCSTA